MKPYFLFSIILIAFFSSIAAKETLPVCPDFIGGTSNDTLKQIYLLNLNRPGPSDGVCISPNQKWIFKGFDLPDKCTCIPIPVLPCK